MKRVIDGKTYNTDTFTVVAHWEYEDQRDCDVEATLYQTRGAAFFAISEWGVEDADWDRRVKTYAEALTRDEVRQLVERINDLEIVASKVLEERKNRRRPAPRSICGSRPYSRNRSKRLPQRTACRPTWAMRCLESCLAQRKRSAGRVAQ